MTDERMLEITRLAKAAFIASDRVVSMGMMNQQNDFEERKQYYVALALAKAEMMETSRLLENAIRQTNEGEVK